MQFITNGPDIPESLLLAHEEGRVVFFCGAGISYPACLPGFKGLVEQIYQLIGTSYTDIEKAAFERGQYDATLDLLERRLPGQRLTVRKALVSALKPKLRRKGAVDTQAALLHLARSRDGALRLVTTNFDRIFHVAAKRTGQKFQEYSSPMLPIPKNSRWDGLVFLHGLIPEKVDDTFLNRLVVTSGDFGLAYLTERWAARFVSELFRNYVVCFVGYSINDPVLRYMMDALAADRMLGEITPQAWALGDCEPGQEHQKSVEWKAKGVTPVLYHVPPGSYDHSALHHTLYAWAETYRDGVQGKEAIVTKHAMSRPQDTTKQDNFVGRMLWALSDESGLPAKRFAEYNPAPSLDWLLEAFSHEHFQYEDLTRFGVIPQKEVDKKLSFSLVRRPASYVHAPYMSIATGGIAQCQWDDVMINISRWLVRHLNDPRLVIWISERGGQLHESWATLVKSRLERFALLEHKGVISELDDIRTNSPNAIPGPFMRTLWDLLLTGRVISPWHRLDLYHWISRIKCEGVTTTLRLSLRELLAPKVALKKPHSWGYGLSHADELTTIKQLVDYELVLASVNVYPALQELDGDNWTKALPSLLEEFQQLLRDALDLLHVLGEADDKRDRSYWDLPSVSPHWQNRGYQDWVSLIELLRDSWLAVRAKNTSRAAMIALHWFDIPYPTFKRLALFAASHDECLSSVQWTRWLLEDNAKWLWSSETGREVYRLLVLQGRHLDAQSQKELETAILKGPPRKMSWMPPEEEQWQYIVDHSVWLHLAKLSFSGLALSEMASARLKELSSRYPQWQLADNESDEFSHWMSGTGDPDYEENRHVDLAPRKWKELVKWLPQKPSNQREFNEDTWRDVCRTRFFHSMYALHELAKDDVWPEERWREAFQTWADGGLVLRSWRYLASLVSVMPDSIFEKIVYSVAWWIENVSKTIDCKEQILLSLCERVLELPLEKGSGSHFISNGVKTFSPVTSAINHPVGHISQALINLWFKHNPNDNELLPDTLKPSFTNLCDPKSEKFIHGRVLLSSQLIALFRVDRPWTEKYLLPFFDWCNPVEARAVWEGFLWSPRLYQPLLTAFKDQFLDCSNHYEELGEHRQQYASLLTYAALGPIIDYTIDEFRGAISALPQEGLEKIALALYQAQEGAGNQREDYWKNRILPFWRNIWPKSLELMTQQISASLTQLVIATGSEFPLALKEMLDWLQPIDHPNYVIHRLYESGLCKRFPVEVVVLLNAIISTESRRWLPEKFSCCLNEIYQTLPLLEQDAGYLRLSNYYRKNQN
ncbi:hypothetical protein D0U00_17185 [Leclercia adecarboxylata]|uniref:anti-phage defense-associated sirtuin Dsr1 n=1 Tax=Leclercia adecarboxylata TaxID=83655 RepID=UPI000E3E37C5|nr:anti-phage defense-associated sirtuin Dsr1 [Leclercia adecarboxylata]RFS77888.1 hypothetical protein D0U00_17185 [Leclercia adecarboxylata]